MDRRPDRVFPDGCGGGSWPLVSSATMAEIDALASRAARVVGARKWLHPAVAEIVKDALIDRLRSHEMPPSEPLRWSIAVAQCAVTRLRREARRTTRLDETQANELEARPERGDRESRSGQLRSALLRLSAFATQRQQSVVHAAIGALRWSDSAAALGTSNWNAKQAMGSAIRALLAIAAANGVAPPAA